MSFGRFIAPCLRCRRKTVFSQYNRHQICERKGCTRKLDLSRVKRRPARATHIAGYVPPAGSVAWSLLGVMR